MAIFKPAKVAPAKTKVILSEKWSIEQLEGWP